MPENLIMGFQRLTNVKYTSSNEQRYRHHDILLKSMVTITNKQKHISWFQVICFYNKPIDCNSAFLVQSTKFCEDL